MVSKVDVKPMLLFNVLMTSPVPMFSGSHSTGRSVAVKLAYAVNLMFVLSVAFMSESMVAFE